MAGACARLSELYRGVDARDTLSVNSTPARLKTKASEHDTRHVGRIAVRGVLTGFGSELQADRSTWDKCLVPTLDS